MHKTVKSDIFFFSIVAISLRGLNLGILQRIKQLYTFYFLLFLQCRERQELDWPIHRQWCMSQSRESFYHSLVGKYITRHRNMYVRFALEAMDFFNVYLHLTGCERAVFMRSNSHFLHVTLERVQSPGRGQHNELAFAAASVRGTSELEGAGNIMHGLVARFPAILLGFTVLI